MSTLSDTSNAEVGVHRLVRISPFDPARRRQTSFARVEVLPTADDDDSEVELRSDDLKMDFFRSSGPGGQNVQKVASAVRLTHVPTGIVVSCQTERSQHQNRDYAMRILRAKLLALREEERAQELSAFAANGSPPNGATRYGATCCTRTNRSKITAPTTRWATRTRCWPATSTGSSKPGW